MSSGSILAHADESLPYGFAKGLKQACEEVLERRQGKTVTRKKAQESSGGRARANMLRSASLPELVREVQRRLKLEQRRAYRREYMRTWRTAQSAS